MGSVPPSSGPGEAMEGALPTMDHRSRRDRVRGRLGDDLPAAAEWLLVTDPVNVRYLSGFTGTNGQVVIGPTDADDRLVTDGRYEERAAVESPDLRVELSRDPVGVALDAARGSSLGFEGAHLSWEVGDRLHGRGAAADVHVVAFAELVERGRIVKDDGELARIARACLITVRALEWLFAEVVRVGRTEQELAIELERRFIDLGAEGVGFPSIVASGPNAAVPHHLPTKRGLVAGDVLTVDCGAVVDGYHADLTRTVAVGHLDDRLREIHELVRQAQRVGRDAAVPGAAAAGIDDAARNPIRAAGFGERFVHGTGHGVGLQIHEAPAVAESSPATLAGGMALTVEPGVYLPGVGGVRIEDTIVITADGAPRILTDTPHELQVIPT